MKKTFIIILLFISLCLMAQIPQTIDYQGRLADSDGNYLNSVVTVDFLIYGFETGGTAMWGETQDVNCANGVFHIQLGSVTPFPVTLFNFAAPWLELIVGGETLVPRTKIASVPYAIKAETAYSLNSMGTGSGLDADLLDGQNSTDFMLATTDNWVNTTGDTMTGQLIVQDFVGIGIPNPGRMLTVNSSGADPIQWQVNSTIVGQLGSNGSGAGALYLYDNGPITAKVTANGDSYFNGGNVGIGTDTPTSKLTVAGTIESTTGGVKFPDGTTQTTATTSGGDTYTVGDFAQGGIVFWLDETGQHGLVCAKQDQNGGAVVRWYAGTNTFTMAIGDGPYSGKLNTAIIIANQGIGSSWETYAARICNELQITEGGKTYGNWYLPAKQELNLMYQNKSTIDATAIANGGSGFTSAYYWSSTEYFFAVYGNNDHVWIQGFHNGAPLHEAKSYPQYVRAIRAF